MITNSAQEIINACLRQDINALTQYYQWGVNFNSIRDKNGEPLLHLTIAGNKTNSFKTLLSFGVDVEIKNQKEGVSALNFAASTNKIQYVNLLLEKGADVNSRANDGYTPLNNALTFKHFNVAQTLLHTPMIDVNIPSLKKSPPIFNAFRYQRMDVLNEIINHPSFDLTFNLTLLNDTFAYSLKDYLLSFANESQLAFINAYQQAKVFGLKYDLSTCLQYKNVKMHQFPCFNLEGYNNRLGAKAMNEAYHDFYHALVEKSAIPHWATNVFQNVNDALAFSANIFEASAYLNKIQRKEVVIIPSGWDGHTIAFVIHDNMLYRCNRGNLSDGIHGVEEFIITKPKNLNQQIIEQMLTAKGTSQYLQEDIVTLLGLHKVGEIKNPVQIVGNCVWTSLEASLEASLVANFVDEGVNRPLAHHLAKQSYLIWENFDLNQTLKNLVDNATILNNEEVYDDLLISALKGHHDAQNGWDILRGIVILEELSNPYVLETFNQEIGRDVLKYDPLSYQTISYMKHLDPQVSASQDINISSQPANTFNPKKLAQVKEYHQFLKTCDDYRQKIGEVVKLSDILDFPDISVLEKTFSAFMPSEKVEVNSQESTFLNQIFTMLLPVSELALFYS